VTLRIIGPLLVGSGEPAERTGEQGNQVARMFRVGDQYVVPGTGLKGLLRSRAEFILRSVHMSPLQCQNQRCGTCWSCKVFGYGGGQDDSSASVGQRARIRVVDAVVADPCARERQHVAIDRFTGGAADQLLYTMEGLERGSFTLRVEALAPELEPPELAQIRSVLRLVLEDLNDGIIGVGAAVARGYGSVSVDLADAERRGELPSIQAAHAELNRMLEASS
jgi:CRISPR/Cas system CSM-associated protein Csm3 (group 7 of RAMP superfamily)